MVLQAWGAYGVLWPVVHQWLGVSPDVGRGRVTVVPQVPPGQTTASGSRVRLGTGSIDVAAEHRGKTYRTTVTRHGRLVLTIGATLPRGSRIDTATLNGRSVTPQLVSTSRGLEARVRVGLGQGTSAFVLTTR
jgi:hypothetical protein